MNHIMIDLETLGTRYSSVFLSLAAVQFDIDSGQLGAQMNVNISLKSAMDAGLTIDDHTLQWWMEQKPEALRNMLKDPIDLETALHRFTIFLHDIEDQIPVPIKLWGNSAGFDLGILGNGYDKLNLERPWKYRNEMCYRSIVNLYPEIKPADEKENAHFALHDCLWQIKRLVMVKQHLNTFPGIQPEYQFKKP